MECPFCRRPFAAEADCVQHVRDRHALGAPGRWGLAFAAGRPLVRERGLIACWCGEVWAANKWPWHVAQDGGLLNHLLEITLLGTGEAGA